MTSEFRSVNLGFCKFPGLMKNSGCRIGHEMDSEGELDWSYHENTMKIYNMRLFEKCKRKYLETVLNEEWGIKYRRLNIED